MSLESEWSRTPSQPAPIEEIFRAMDNGLPIIAINTGEEVSCGNCKAACCRKGMNLRLSPTEREQMESVGTVLTPSNKFIGPTREDEQVYTLQTDCKNLKDDGRCGIYDTKPVECNRLQAGSLNCMVIRERRGLKHQIGQPPS